MYKISITDDQGKEIEAHVSAEVFEVFENSRKQCIREENQIRRHRDYRGLQNHYVLQELASSIDDLENKVFQKILLNKVFEIVATCTPIQQERFFLYYIYGYTMEEIGTFQGCTKMAVSRSLKKVIVIIKKKLLF